MLITQLQIFVRRGVTVRLGVSATDVCLGEKVKLKSEHSKRFFPQSFELADMAEYLNDKLSLQVLKIWLNVWLRGRRHPQKYPQEISALVFKY